jgi:FkbM family methyltransferase
MSSIDLLLQHNIIPNGVIHIGIHDGDEIEIYNNLNIKNIICFEPMPEAIEVFRSRFPYQDIQPLALSSASGVRSFFVTNDGRQSQTSSFFDIRPEYINMTGGIKDIINVDTIRFDEWYKDNNINLSNYDTLIIDTQGSELEVLQGFGNLLSIFKYFIIECSEKAIYIGGSDAQLVVDYLNQYDIIPITPIMEHDDVLFIKKEVIA